MSCCSFGELYQDVYSHEMPPDVKHDLLQLSQEKRNDYVKWWVSLSNGKYSCIDRCGTDGIIYTAFWRN